MKNPFLTYGYAGAEYFCDRKEETQRLLALLSNGNHVALMSPRRMGKTAFYITVSRKTKLKKSTTPLSSTSMPQNRCQSLLISLARRY